MTRPQIFAWSLGALLLAAVAGTSARALEIEVVYDDAAGQGFLDPVRGELRRLALEAAVDQWEGTLAGTVPIVVVANMPALGGTGANALLASAGAISLHRNFSNGRAATWYAAALASQIAHGDLNGPAVAEIGISFNADVDRPDVLGSIGWYYGLDAQPGADIDFFTIALHEIGHGLGFLDTMDAATGAFRLGDEPSILERMLIRPEIGGLSDLLGAERLAAIIAPADLLWDGAAVVAFNGSSLPVYSPDPFQPGSSIAHWHPQLSNAELMAPFYTQANHDLGALLPALIDLGWEVARDTPAPRAAPATPTATRPPRPSATPDLQRTKRDKVYVTNFDDATVSVIDAATRAVVRTIAIDDGPMGIAASSDGTRVYVAAFQAGTLAVVRTGDDRVIASVRVGESPHSVAVTRDGAFIAISDTATDRVAIVAADTLDLLAHVPGGRQPSSIALAGDDRRAFVSNFSGATVTVVDLPARRRRAIMPLSFVTASDGLLGIAIAPATGRGFVTSFYGSWTRPLRADSLLVGEFIYPFSNDARPEAVVTDTAGELAYFVGHDPESGRGRLWVMRMGDNGVLSEVLVGRVPEALALAPDETLLYVANTGSNDVSIVDTVQRIVLGSSIPVGQAPMGIVAVAVPDGQCVDDCETPTAPPTSTATAIPISTRTAASPLCECDCNGDGSIAVNELVTAVAIALGQQPLAGCPPADSDRDGSVSVADLVRAVSRALAGCSE